MEHIANQVSKLIISDKKAKKEHKKYVKSNIYERERNIKAFICPNCKGELVIRKGEYGQFYGCSNFPTCKFSTKNITLAVASLLQRSLRISLENALRHKRRTARVKEQVNGKETMDFHSIHISLNLLHHEKQFPIRYSP